MTKEYIEKIKNMISKWQKTSHAHTYTQSYTNEEKKRKEREGGGTQSDINKTNILK